MIILIVATVCLVKLAHPETEDTQTFYSLDYGGLLVEIKAPAQAWPGNKINITIRAEASAKIHINFIRANITSLKEGREEIPLLSTVTFLENKDLEPGEFNETIYEVTIPEDALPGLIYGMAWYNWYIKGTAPATFEMLPQAFPATFIENKPYLDLKEDYDALNSSYNELQGKYASLKTNHTDLQEKYQQLAGSQNAQGNATGLMYLFLITTGIFVVTTVLLLVKRPKAAAW